MPFNFYQFFFGTSGDDFYAPTNPDKHQKIFGFGGNDELFGGNKADLIFGGSGDDDVSAGDGNDYIFGGRGDDILRGQGGNDHIYGGRGNDTLGPGNNPGDVDYLFGGRGNDTASFASATAAVHADLTTGVATHGTATAFMEGIENLRGSPQDDTLIGDDKDNILDGRDGDDVIIGGKGNDVLIGDRTFQQGDVGADQLFGGEGDDLLFPGAGPDGAINNIVDGGEGGEVLGDTVEFPNAGAGNPNNDNGVIVDLLAGTASIGANNNYTIIDIENATGGVENDILRGDADDNILNGAAGDDLLVGRGGEDTFIGGAGNDILDGTGGGLDTADYSTDAANGGLQGIRVNQHATDIQGGLNPDTVIDGFGDTDTIVGVRNIIGTDFNDEIFGGGNANTIYALGGDDIVFGRGDDDVIFGGDGDDTINGQGDNDRIEGGLGADVLRGSSGNDRFAYSSVLDSQGATIDEIEDFTSGVDLIDISAITSGVGTYLGEDVALTGNSGDAYLDTSSNLLNVDVDGDGTIDGADLSIELAGVVDLQVGDIIF